MTTEPERLMTWAEWHEALREEIATDATDDYLASNRDLEDLHVLAVRVARIQHAEVQA